MPDDDTVTLPKSIIKAKIDDVKIEISEVLESVSQNLAPQETYDNLQRIEYIEKTKFQTSITCANCGLTAEFESNELFEKVQCPNCKVKFRIPIETNLFIYDKQIFESLFIHIFRAHDKKNNFYGDVVVYEKLQSDAKLEDLQEMAAEFEKFKVINYLAPQHVDIDETTYYFSRDNAPYRMNFYLDSFGALPKDRTSHTLSQICHLAENMVEHDLLGSFLPADIMFSKDGEVYLCDYALREKIHALNPRYNYIPICYLAPETIFNKNHTQASAVYSLGILAATFLLGENPFSEKDPHQINFERNQFITEFEKYKLPPFLKSLLAYKAEDRPTFSKCAELFMRMQLRS
jgi:predicted Zn-ribbon and HTH transcriptional regulator